MEIDEDYEFVDAFRANNENIVKMRMPWIVVVDEAELQRMQLTANDLVSLDAGWDNTVPKWARLDQVKNYMRYHSAKNSMQESDALRVLKEAEDRKIKHGEVNPQLGTDVGYANVD